MNKKRWFLWGAALAGAYSIWHRPLDRLPADSKSLERYSDETLLNLSTYSDYREVLIHSTGTKIALSLYESGKQAPCIIFLPGTMVHPLFYDEFLTALAKNGFNVVGVHLVSHGKSPRERKLYSFQDMVQNTADAISYCIQRFNDNVILMGSSQGGILSLACACQDKRIKAVFPHNVLLPSLPDSIRVTRFPEFLKPFHKIIPHLMNLGAKIIPDYQIPGTFYLDLTRVFTVQSTQERFFSDPLALTSYPLFFLASLFSADLSGVTDGSLHCPVVVIASTGDPLFPYDYCLEVYEQIVTTQKEMLVLNEPHHLIFNECIETVVDPIVNKLKSYT